MTLETLQIQILKRLFDGGNADSESYAKAYLVGTELQSGLFDGWGKRRLNIDYAATDNAALAAMEYNLFHFAHNREAASLIYLNQLLIDRDKNAIRTFNDFKRMAEPHLTMLNEHWLRTEYNLAVSTGQNASAYHKHLSDIDDIPYIQYQTAGDKNVRNEHARLDGLVFRLEDKEARRLYPPNGHGCRCEMVQYLGTPDKVTSGDTGLGMLPERDLKNFGINRGEIGEVFTVNQLYIQKKEWATDINNLTYADYGLESYDAMQKSKPALNIDKTITPTNVTELFKPDEQKNMPFKDYLNRNLVLSESTFKKHLKEHYVNDSEQRHRLFPFIQSALSKPDEVYMLKKNETVQLRYIKLYNNTVIVVDTHIKNNKTEIKTWYQQKINEADLRKGIIIKQG